MITLLPVPLVSLLYAVHSTLTATPAETYPLTTGCLVYGFVNLLVVGLLYGLLTPDERSNGHHWRRVPLRSSRWSPGSACIRLPPE